MMAAASYLGPMAPFLKLFVGMVTLPVQIIFPPHTSS